MVIINNDKNDDINLVNDNNANKNNNVVIIVKKTENIKNKQNSQKCMFSCNHIYPVPLEQPFLHISVATIAAFPCTSLISSN